MRAARTTGQTRTALERAVLSRRDLLKGALIVGFSMTGGVRRLSAAGDPPLDQLDSWVAIAQDGSVTAYSGKCDFGQGFATVQKQLVAEELYVSLDRVTLIACDTALTPDQGTTDGSQSDPTEFGPSGLRQALATAREALIQMASDQLGVPVTSLAVQDGVISVIGASQQVTYAELIGGKKFTLNVQSSATPKNPAQYTILGTSTPRTDLPSKLTGAYQFVQHVRPSGMLHGKVVRPPTVGAHVVNVNPSSVSNLPGGVQVVVKKDFVGVVADTQYHATQAAAALDVTWSAGDALPDQQNFYNYMRRQSSRDAYTVATSDIGAMLKQAARTLAATYLYPYQMHGSIASSAAVADVEGSGDGAMATIWSATQGVYPQRDSLAVALGIPKQNVRVIFVEGSGCYGLNGNDTVSYDAALLSQAVGKPVRVQFTRKEEMVAGESYGPAFVIDLRAGLDDQGRMIAWDREAWTLSKGNRPDEQDPGNILTGALLGFPTPPLVPAAATPPTSYSNNSNAAASYGAGLIGETAGGTGNVRSERVLTHTIALPFFTGPLRSPARLQNTFANESFIDELAAVVKADSVQYRMMHLTDQRLIDALNSAAHAANWDTRPSPKPGNAHTGIVTGRGISCVLYEGGNGYSALVAEVQVDQDTGVITVQRLVASQDSGPISNPDGMRNQMEGGALQGMSRALREEVTWNGQSITSLDWKTYPVVPFGEPLPVVETVLINRPDQPKYGAGECTITLAPAAIANAVFDATGARLRQVPFTAARVMTALQARG